MRDAHGITVWVLSGKWGARPGKCRLEKKCRYESGRKPDDLAGIEGARNFAGVNASMGFIEKKRGGEKEEIAPQSLEGSSESKKVKARSMLRLGKLT